MPNIKVVRQAKKSPLHDNIDIDIEETVNPLGASQRSSVRIKNEHSIKTPVPKIIDEEDPMVDSDEDIHPKIFVKPIELGQEVRDKSATAETAEGDLQASGKHAISIHMQEQDSVNLLHSSHLYSHPGSVQDTSIAFKSNSVV